MIEWNSPYVLAVVLGLIAIGLFHFDQKKKKAEINKLSYVKIFTLVAGSVAVFYYFVLSKETIIESAVETITETITPVKSISPSPSSAFVPIEKPVGPVITNTANSIGGLYSNLKIKEGPPNF
jgi:hypothetical protein